VVEDRYWRVCNNNWLVTICLNSLAYRIHFKISPPTIFLESAINFEHSAVAPLASVQLFHCKCPFAVRIAKQSREILSVEGGKAASILCSDLEINVNSPTVTFLIHFRSLVKSTAALTVSKHFPTTHINVLHPK